jgi:hypothetical protein
LTNPLLPPLPHTLPQAIARVKGFYVDNTTPNRPQRNHNPGDIEYGVLAIGAGATGTDGRFTIFSDDETGFQCLVHLLTGPTYRELTIEQCINKYAPPNENDTVNYVSLVCEWTDFLPTDLVCNRVESLMVINAPPH